MSLRSLVLAATRPSSSRPGASAVLLLREGDRGARASGPTSSRTTTNPGRETMARTRRVPDAGDSPEDACAASSPSPADEGSEPGAGQPPAGPTGMSARRALRRSSPRVDRVDVPHAAMAPAFKGIDWPAYKLYRDRLLADCGGPTDPIEVMLMEQLSTGAFLPGPAACQDDQCRPGRSLRGLLLGRRPG